MISARSGSGPLGMRAVAGSLAADFPLAFLHIAKTGGTSVTRALARLYPPGRVFSDEGNLSIDYLASLGDRLSGPVFLAGHPGPGVANGLVGRADMITVLRNPADQAVSHYLHVLSDPANGLHPVAMSGSFGDFLRRRPGVIDYQASALALALAPDPAPAAAAGADEIDGVLSFLGSLPFVGVIERAEACGRILSRLVGIDGGVILDHHNAASCRGVSTATLERLRREYHALQHEPALAPRFKREARVYARAEAIFARLDRQAPPVCAAPRSRDRVSAARFSTLAGRRDHDDLVVALRDAPTHLVFGPHIRLGRGAYAVAFGFSALGAAPAKGRIEIEVSSNARTCLSRRWLRYGAWTRSGARTLHFVNRAPEDVLEFRIRARGFAGGVVVFAGVTITPCHPLRALPSVLTRLARQLRSAVRQRFAGPRAAA